MSRTKTQPFEMLGRYAEDPPVIVEAATAEEAADYAVRNRLPVRGGYMPGGSLIPTPLSPAAARRWREEQDW